MQQLYRTILFFTALIKFIVTQQDILEVINKLEII